jgi:hypothetical protein
MAHKDMSIRASQAPYKTSTGEEGGASEKVAQPIFDERE